MLRNAIGLIVIGILTYFVYLLSLEKGFESGQYVTGIAVALTVVIISVAYWAFKPQLVRLGVLISEFDMSKDKRDKQENHKREIENQVGSIVRHKHIDYSLDDLSNMDKLEWVRLPLYEEFLSHLQSYKELWAMKKEAEDYAEPINNQIIEKIKQCHQYIDEKIQTFNEIPEGDRYMGATKPCFLKKTMKAQILNDIENHFLSEVPIKAVDIHPYGNSAFWYLQVNGSDCATGEEKTLKKLFEMVKPLPFDQNLLSLVKEIIELKKMSEDNPALRKFNMMRSELFRELTLGQKDLKGKCHFCH